MFGSIVAIRLMVLCSQIYASFASVLSRTSIFQSPTLQLFPKHASHTNYSLQRILKDSGWASLTMQQSGHTTSSDSSDRYHNNEKYLDKKKFCLILMIKPDKALESFVAECKENCSEKVYRQCALVPDLYHITLFANKWLSYEEAMSISYGNPSFSKHTTDNENNETGEMIDVPKLPVLNMNGLLDWTHCIALHTNTKLDEWITNIHSSFSWELNNVLHLTLYRIRGRNKEKVEQFQRIQNAFQDANKNHFGVANGTKIVLKEMGARYDGKDGRFFRIIHEEK